MTKHSYTSLKEIHGTKMRKQWFFTLLLLILCIPLLFLWVDIVVVAGDALFDFGVEPDIKQDVIDLVSIFLKPIIILAILSIFNLKLFGKTVAVVTEDGIYTDKYFISWEDIHEIIFFTPEIPSLKFRHSTSFSYTEIFSTQGTCKIYEMPLWFLFKAKRFDRQIKCSIKIDKWYIILGVFVVLMPILMMVLKVLGFN